MLIQTVYISNFVVSNCTSASIWFFFVFPSQLGIRNDVFFSWKLSNFGSNVMRFVGQRNFDESYLPLWNPFKTKNQKQLFFITQFDKWMILKDVFLLIFQYLTFFIRLNDDRSKFPHRFFFAWKWQITSSMIHLHVCGKWLFSQGSGALFKGMVTVVKELTLTVKKVSEIIRRWIEY